MVHRDRCSAYSRCFGQNGIPYRAPHVPYPPRTVYVLRDDPSRVALGFVARARLGWLPLQGLLLPLIALTTMSDGLLRALEQRLLGWRDVQGNGSA